MIYNSTTKNSQISHFFIRHIRTIRNFKAKLEKFLEINEEKMIKKRGNFNTKEMKKNIKLKSTCISELIIKHVKSSMKNNQSLETIND